MHSWKEINLIKLVSFYSKQVPLVSKQAMKKYLQRRRHAEASGTKLAKVRPQGGAVQVSKKKAGVFTTLVLATNFITYALFTPGMFVAAPSASYSNSHRTELYLMDKASKFVLDVRGFDKKVRKVAKKLEIPPEWLMAVMYSESSFDASVANRKGSGATGLIQFTATTAKEMNTTIEKLRNLNHIEQLDYVYKYLNTVKKRYGSYKSLTDLYLGILYPRALDQDYCYTLYAKPSLTYSRNAGLDEDKDGRVTVSDIDKRMQRIFPTAFAIQLGEEGEE